MQTINVNPMATTNASGSFSLDSDGFIQGFSMDDPAYRNWLAGGVLDPAESLPMWGGVGITELVPNAFAPTGHQPELGGNIRRATNISASGAALSLTGFSVFDQAHHMINTPQSPVPVALANMSVHFFRLGSQARIPVACDPQLIDIRGNPITSQVSWDFVNQRLVEYSPPYGQATISGAVWSNTNGGQINFTVNVDYQTLLSAGDSINVANVVNTGGASTSAFNGAWTVVSVPDATHVIVAAPAQASIGTYASGGNVQAGGGALPVRILNVKQTNCKTVVWDAVNQQASWNNNGCCALILI
jgi:hypothetical protein